MQHAMSNLQRRFLAVRSLTEALVEPLAPEDTGLQPEPDVSPARWHLAHTSWFFEAFVLQAFDATYRPFDPRLGALFNSYYEAVGARHPRSRRGDLSRPLLHEVLAWRAHVDRAVLALLGRDPDACPPEVVRRIELGLHHEQQHQELLIMDVKAAFHAQPLRPVHRQAPLAPTGPAPDLGWVDVDGGLVEVGAGSDGFAFDNERPRHRVFLAPYALGTRCVTVAEWQGFVDDGGYRSPALWLSDGWAWVQAEGVAAPRYWVPDGEGGFGLFTSHGLVDLDPHAPVVHVSGYEAEAFAAWAGARLPTESEWEHAFARVPTEASGTFLEGGRWHPAAATPGAGLRQGFGDVWEWTRSAYLPYPGFRPLEGALGEYNGKFMASQWVLRGGCCATPRDHVRATYRNYYYPHQRWAFAGLRLARDAR